MENKKTNEGDTPVSINSKSRSKSWNKSGDRSENREKGRIGEDVASKFLVKHGFLIIERNYLKKWGEIDIVARKEGILHFIEVKSSWSTSLSGRSSLDSYNLADNVHFMKRARLKRTIQTYIAEKGIDREMLLSIDVALVTLDRGRRVGRVAFLENICL